MIDPSIVAEGITILLDLIDKLRSAKTEADIAEVLPKLRALKADLLAAPAVERADHASQIANAVKDIPDSSPITARPVIEAEPSAE